MTKTLTFQIASIVFSKDNFNIVRSTNGDTVSGNFLAQQGCVYTAEGEWDSSSDRALRYGPTFKISSATQVEMTTPRALGKYLTLRFKNSGIGAVFFANLIEGCEEAELDLGRLLDTNDEDTLVSLVGARPSNVKKVQRLLEEWPKLKPKADLVSPLLGYGLTESQASTLVSLYGVKALSFVRETPYDLIHVLAGISFLRADQIATRVGRIGPRDPVRIRAAITTSLVDATNGGSLGVRRRELIKKVRMLVNDLITVEGKKVIDEAKPIKVPDELIEQELGEMLKGTAIDPEGNPCPFSKTIVELNDEKGEKAIWSTRLLEAEDLVVKSLSSFEAKPLSHLIPRVKEMIDGAKVTLAPEQMAAIEMVLTQPVSIITGGPGCGKSFILGWILKALDMAGLRGNLVAPTGKAAKRMTESTSRFAQTIHSLIGYAGKKSMFNKENPLPADYLIIDEFSMSDIELTAALLDACPPKCRIIIIGDVDQLASVGPGQVLLDMIRSKVLTVTRLKRGFRFGGGIAKAAEMINQGKLPSSSDDGQFEYIDTDSPKEAVIDKVIELMKKGVSVDDIQILSPTNKGNSGCELLNVSIQKLINPAAEHGSKTQRIARETGDIYVNDRVIQTKNLASLKIVNGDIGWIDDISSHNGNVSTTIAGKTDPVIFEMSDTQFLKLGYVITIHKSQGAEAPYVLTVVGSEATFMLNRRLVYTAITRASKKTVLIGSINTLTRAVRIGEPPEGSRRTLLCSKLRAAFPERAQLEIQERVSTELEAMFKTFAQDELAI